MGRVTGSKNPKQPESESEQLIYYRAKDKLRDSAVDEDTANDALIAIYRQQCIHIAEIKTFMSWDEIGRILGISGPSAQTRFRNYSNGPVKEILGE